MKKVTILVMALAIAMAFATTAFAKNGLSVDFGIGYNADMAGMGATILNDGEEGTNGTYLGANADVLISQKDAKILAANGATTGISNVADAGTMGGVCLNLGVRYDILNLLWFKTGFNYDVNIASEQSWNATDGATFNGKVKQTWTAGYMAIPIMLGLNLPIQDGKYNVYAGVGLDIFWGYWQVEVSAPGNYITGIAAAFKEKAKLETMGVGIHYTLGFDMEVIKNLYVFVEYDVVQAGAISDKVNLGDPTSGTDAIATGLGTPYLYYPVNVSKSTFKFGVKYHIGFGTI